MKKSISLLLVLLMCVPLFSGCGKGATKETSKGDTTTESKEAKPEKIEVKEITLGIWDENQKDTLQLIADKFNSEHDDINVSLELTPWANYWTKLDAAAGAGEAPDIFWMNVYLPKYVDANLLLPLDEYIARDGIELSKYAEATTKTYNYEGIQWAMPKGLDSVAVAYNKAIFDKYNVEYPKEGWTWDEMRTIAEKLKVGMEAGGDEYPILMELDAQPSHFNFVYQTGGEVINDDYTQSGYNKPETAKGLQNIVDLLNDKLLAPYIVLSETKGTDLFLSGKGAILFTGSWKASVLEESQIAKDGNVGMITMPKQDVSNASVLGGLGYTIYKNSANPDAAWEFVKFITGPEGNKIQAEAGIDIPAYSESQQYYLGNFKNIDVGAFFKAADSGVKFPAGPHFTQWLGIVEDNIARIFGQEISVEEGTDIIHKEIERIINEK